MRDFGEMTFTELTESLASAAPVPGAGPSLAWTCAIAAALVEMVNGVLLRKQPAELEALERNQLRARTLRERAAALADVDAAAYRRVLDVQRRRDEPGHARRLREALSDATDPLVTIIETAGELASLAADAAAEARGGVRGEAITATVLAASVAQAGVPLVALNLGGAPDDPRIARVRSIADEADAERARVVAA